MPSNLDYDPYNMHDIYCPPWLRRGDREATDPAFLARASARRRALTPALASGASVGDFDKPDTAFSGGNYPPVPFDDEWERKADRVIQTRLGQQARRWQAHTVGSDWTDLAVHNTHPARQRSKQRWQLTTAK